MLSCWSGGTARVEQVGQTRLELQQLGAGSQVLAGGAGVAEAMRARRPAAPARAGVRRNPALCGMQAGVGLPEQ